MVGKDLCSTSLTFLKFLKSFLDFHISREHSPDILQNMLEKVTLKVTFFDVFLVCLVALCLFCVVLFC